MRYYYAFDWLYGPYVTNSQLQPLGTLHVFASRKQRDAWVSADTWDGDYHRTPYPSRDAYRHADYSAVIHGDIDAHTVPALRDVSPYEGWY